MKEVSPSPDHCKLAYLCKQEVNCEQGHEPGQIQLSGVIRETTRLSGEKRTEQDDRRNWRHGDSYTKLLNWGQAKCLSL